MRSLRSRVIKNSDLHFKFRLAVYEQLKLGILQNELIKGA